ncbi:hypothetical protein NIES4071_87540 [Calothrix sp. NIES-4071]|nr:hypothetical protein NIES4071_87540 [Calothrix sp. NIES-4071]BAZ63021.1 hypothetical protein NIES4105_87470 [Calothrix sp. NIES-4105]
MPALDLVYLSIFFDSITFDIPPTITLSIYLALGTVQQMPEDSVMLAIEAIMII